MRIKALAAFAVLAVAANAFAVVYEQEPNDTLPDADPIPLTCNPPSAEIALGTLLNPPGGGGDTDLYSIFVPSGCILTGITTPFSSLPANFNTPDTLLGLLNSGGGLITENDDAGDSFSDVPPGPPVNVPRGSAVRFYNSGASDVFYFRVRGYLADQGAYALTVSLFPEPATIGLLLGGLAFAARRRK